MTEAWAQTSATCPAENGCACVPHLSTPADRVASLQQLLGAEPEPVVAVTHLLRLCRDEHPTLWERHADARCRTRVGDLIAPVALALPDPGVATSIPPAARERLAAALTSDPDIPPVVIAHALAELIDARFGHSFASWFRDRSPYRPATGDPVPLDRPDLRRVTDLAPTAPPWRLANRLDETRRLRLAGAWATQFQMVFDYTASDALGRLIDADTVIATCHPNHDLAELGLGAGDHPAFPVQPVDPHDQRARIDKLLRDATEEGATVVVLPELSVTPAIAQELEQWVRRPGSLRLLVAGSFHDGTTSTGRVNRALAWVRGHTAPLTQDKHSPADRPLAEDLTPTGWPEIRVHVTSDGWHVVIAVCRDLLNPAAVHALAEAGANLVLAPAMTEAMLPFGGPVAQLVGAGQALVAVANNPCRWVADDRTGGQSPARALFGHPGFAQQTRQVHAGDDEPGVALLHVRSGRLGWHSNHDRVGSGSTIEGKDGPPWADLLRRRSAAPTSLPATVSLRTAAVLVVLTVGPDGPEVVLTTRAADLTDYPDQVVFPGGVADPADAGSVETALREAHEEIGLDARSVHIIGTLPAIGLPSSGFLVTPVLAWSQELQFLHGTNPAEVTDVHRLPLSRWRGRAATSDWPGASIGAMTTAVLDIITALTVATDDVTAGLANERGLGTHPQSRSVARTDGEVGVTAHDDDIAST